MMNNSLLFEFFLFGMTSGISISLLFLCGHRLSVAMNTMLLSLWSISRISGWANAESVIVGAFLVFGVYCGFVLFRVRASNATRTNSEEEHERDLDRK